MYKIFGDSQSGNCYKIKLLMKLLNINHDWIHVNILTGETHTPEFLALNPNGKIPLMLIAGSETLWESNAILNYLADNTDYLPSTRLARAKILQWQFFEQYSHEPYIAVARYINKYLGLPAERLDEYHAKQKGGHKALAVMEKQLSDSEFLVGQTPTIADISLYAYTHVAHEGGFDLSPYANINRWLKSIESLRNYVSMNCKSQ